MKKLLWSYSKQFKKKIERMFNKQKEIYDLKTSLELTNYIQDTFYDTDKDKIRSFIPLKYQQLKDMAIFGLFHELKHAIDYKSNPKKFAIEIGKAGNQGAFGLYKNHSNLPFEKRANKFAELKSGLKTDNVNSIL